MNKVLVDRELLERAMYAKDGKELIAANRELRAILAQPAEAEGVEVVAWLHRQGNHTEAADRPLTEDEEARGWEQDELLTVTQHLAALSAVTAERDRLREDAERYRWLRGRLPGSAYRIAGVIYSEGGDGVDAAVDAAMAAKEA